MAKLYTLLGLIKSGTSAGGKFDGPSVKKIILEENLQILSQMLPADKEPFMEFLRSCNQLHVSRPSRSHPIIDAKVAQNFGTMR